MLAILRQNLAALEGLAILDSQPAQRLRLCNQQLFTMAAAASSAQLSTVHHQAVELQSMINSAARLSIRGIMESVATAFSQLSDQVHREPARQPDRSFRAARSHRWLIISVSAAGLAFLMHLFWIWACLAPGGGPTQSLFQHWGIGCCGLAGTALFPVRWLQKRAWRQAFPDEWQRWKDKVEALEQLVVKLKSDSLLSLRQAVPALSSVGLGEAIRMLESLQPRAPLLDAYRTSVRALKRKSTFSTLLHSAWQQRLLRRRLELGLSEMEAWPIEIEVNGSINNPRDG